MYRNMLKIARGISPEKKRQDAIQSVRSQFREHAGEEDTNKIAELLTKANSSLGYLKMISPKMRGVGSGQQTGRTRITFGGNMKKGRAVVSNWTGANMDPDQVSRHYNQLKRAGFTDNRSVTGPQF